MLLVMDSGIGGLSVADAIRALLPETGMTYLADHGGFPYGALSDTALTERLLRVIGDAIDRVRPDAVVVACNTASTVALGALRARFALPFVGCVPPIKPAAAVSVTRHIGLLATPATVRRAYVQDLVTRFAHDCTVFSRGGLVLAEQAERVFGGEDPDLPALRGEMAQLFARPGADRIDAIVLGCTHYAFLLPYLRALAPGIEHWLDPAAPVARRVASVLPRHSDPPAPGLAISTAPLAPETVSGLARHGFPRLELL